MNIVFLILSAAHSGLGVAATFLESKAKSEEAKGDTKSAEKDRNLAKILKAADAGIIDYLSNLS